MDPAQLQFNRHRIKMNFNRGQCHKGVGSSLTHILVCGFPATTEPSLIR